MRREMVTVPALLGFAAFALLAGHHGLAVAAFVIAAIDALTGQT